MTRADVIAQLFAQHQTLRAIMGRCDDLATELDGGRDVAEPLAREIVRLRVALDHHNKTEEQQLRAILHDGDAHGDARIDNMVADHVEEHGAMYRRFGPLVRTYELRETLALLRGHLAAEERVFVAVQRT